MQSIMADKWKNVNLKPKLTITCLVLSKILLVALPIAQITLGAKYLKECTQQNYIPMFVLVCGVFGMIMILLSCLPCRQKDHSTFSCLCTIWNGLVSGFTFCWFIAGSVWIYTTYPPNYNSTVVSEPYCNKTLYLFAFWSTTVVYISLAVFLVGSCCFYLCSCICNLISSTEEGP